MKVASEATENSQLEPKVVFIKKKDHTILNVLCARGIFTASPLCILWSHRKKLLVECAFFTEADYYYEKNKNY